MPRSHGKSRTPEHMIWLQVKQRCLNPKNKRYKYYGARGIDIDPEWVKSFETFLGDVGERPEKGMTLDRIDNNKGYWRWNVRWTDWTTQSSNRRTAVSVKIDGKEMTAAEASRHLGLARNAISYRLRGGVAPERALTGGILKGRELRGEYNSDNVWYKVSVPDVRKIRELSKSMKRMAISKQYGLSVSTIYRIINKVSWGWVE